MSDMDKLNEIKFRTCGQGTAIVYAAKEFGIIDAYRLANALGFGIEEVSSCDEEDKETLLRVICGM